MEYDTLILGLILGMTFESLANLYYRDKGYPVKVNILEKAIDLRKNIKKDEWF